MSEFNFPCPHCKTDMLCSDSHRGSLVDCPQCGKSVSVPMAPRSFVGSLPTRAPSRATRGGPSEMSLLVKLGGAAAGVGLLAALALMVLGDSSPEISQFGLATGAFLLGAGGVLILVTGLMILFNAFRESIWWGLGFFVPFIGGIISLTFVFKHWGRNGKLFLTNLGGSLLVMGGVALCGTTAAEGLGEGLSVEWEFERDGQEMAASPKEVFEKFQAAAKQNDYSAAFRFLAPNLQDEQLDMYVATVMGARMMRGDPAMKRVAEEGERVLNLHGLPVSKLDEEMQNQLKAAFSGEKSSRESEESPYSKLYVAVPDKGRLYQELGKAVKMASGAEEVDMLASLAASPLSDLKVAGTTATGKAVVMRDIPIQVAFTQQGVRWQISGMEFPDVGKVMARVAKQFEEFNGGNSRPPTRAAPAVEDRVVKFQRHSALSGNRTAQYDLGMRYLRGDGVEQDDEQARHWLKLAADQGHTQAQKALTQLESKQQ